jgi:hypothetical protein
MASRRHDVDAMAEEKRRVLRSIKDLEAEHALGKIDEADYEALSMQYRDQAKALMREMDDSTAPAMAEAEKLAAEYLAAQGLGAKHADEVEEGGEITAPARMACASCGVSNEPDAAFCKKCGATIGARESSETTGDATS